MGSRCGQGFRAYSFGFGKGFMVCIVLGFRVQGLGFRV